MRLLPPLVHDLMRNNAPNSPITKTNWINCNVSTLQISRASIVVICSIQCKLFDLIAEFYSTFIKLKMLSRQLCTFNNLSTALRAY